MKSLFLLSILLSSALAASAGEVAAPALLDLEKQLTEKQKGKQDGDVSPEQFQAFLDDFRPELSETMAGVSPSSENTAAHARILVMLGEHAKATAALNQALEKTPADATLKLTLGETQLAGNDYAGALGTANEILKADPENKNALFLKNRSEGRIAPSGANNQLVASVATAASSTNQSVDNRPLRPRMALGPSTAPPPLVKNDPAPPAGNRAPWLPYAIGATLTMIGIGLSIKHAREQAGDIAQKAEEKTLDGIGNLYDKGKDFVQEHPKTTIAVGVGAVALTAWLVLPTVGIGGGGLMLATAGGGTTTVAASGAGVGAIKVSAIAVGAAAPILMAGDANPKNESGSKKDEPNLSEEKIGELEAEGSRPDPSDKGAKLTKAGRGLFKHARRPSTRLKPVSGPTASINEQGKAFLRDILRNRKSVEYSSSTNWGKVIDIKGHNGFGVRFSSDGKFLYFIE